MKRLLAILALVGVVLAFPLTSIAVDDHDGCQSQGEAEGLYVPPNGDHDADVPMDQDSHGDPDELGGGFRGTGPPPDTDGTGGPGFWIPTIIVMLMQLW